MIEKIAQEWEIRGFTCDLWEDPPGQRWENYHHDEDELFLLLEGDIELEIDGKTIVPSINEVIHIPAFCIHSVRNKGTKKARWLYGYRQKSANEGDIELFNK